MSLRPLSLFAFVLLFALGGLPAAAQDATPEATDLPAVPGLFVHEFGSTEVAAVPERIFAADLGFFIPTLGVLAALDVPPVGAVVNVVPSYLEDFVAENEIELIAAPPSYEAITALDPDLIITPGYSFNQDNYNSLTLIAPTVAPLWYWQTLEQVTGYWQSVAALVGQPEQGEQLIADLDAHIAQVRDAVAERMQGKTVSVFQVQGTGLEALYLQTGRLESALLSAVGVARPENQTYDPENPVWYIQLSPELLNEVDAWAIFVEVFSDQPEEIDAIRAELEANPLWRNLDAVQNDRVFFVPTDVWSGTDPFVAGFILDLIETNLTAALDAEAGA